MARNNEEPSAANLIHHYTHVVCALNESRKGSPDTDTTTAIDKTIKGVCGLIDTLVTEAHKERADTGAH